jgi:hypothetical protein
MTLVAPANQKLEIRNQKLRGGVSQLEIRNQKLEIGWRGSQLITHNS